MKTPWWIYLIECGDGTIYTGIATDVDKRLKKHLAGHGAKYTRGRLPLRIAAKWEVGTVSDALRLEFRVKKLCRADKDRLIQDEGFRRWFLLSCSPPSAPLQ